MQPYHSMTADHMKWLRQRWHLSQSDLGVLLEKTRQSVSLWERDETPIPRAIAAHCWLIAMYGPRMAIDPWNWQSDLRDECKPLNCARP